MSLAQGMDRLVETSRDLAALPITWSWQMFLVLAVAWLALKFDRSHSAATSSRPFERCDSLPAVGVVPGEL